MMEVVQKPWREASLITPLLIISGAEAACHMADSGEGERRIYSCVRHTD